jgi:hypothetical protein
MELENRSRYPAALFRGVINDDRLFASLAVRITFDLKQSKLIEAADQPWKVSASPWESPCGPMPGDELFRRGGVDVFVFGSAIPHHGRPAPRVNIMVRLGASFKHTLAVFGNRVWERRGGDLVATDPEPFTDIPLTLANAYGGRDVWDELPIPFPANPDGKGFAVSEESAEGKPLPNIENAAHLVQKWNDQPEPVGVCAPPQFFGPKLHRTLAFDDRTHALTKIDAKFFNMAFPDMVAARVGPGDKVGVSGVGAAGPIVFTLPPTPIRARLTFDGRANELTPPIDQIGIDASRGKVFVSYRYSFRYKLMTLTKRTCELLPVA